MATVEIPCAYCSKTEAVVNNGKVPSKFQRFFCKLCKRSFQTGFIYLENYPDIPANSTMIFQVELVKINRKISEQFRLD